MDTQLTPTELDALLEAAKAATPGPYEARLGSGNNVCTALASVAPDSFDDFVCDVLPDYACKPGIATRWEANRNFIEQANPATITRLVLMVRELQGEVEELAGQLIRSADRSGELLLTLQRYRVRAVSAIRQADVHDSDCFYRTHNGACDCPHGRTLKSVATTIESLPLVETEEE